MSHFGSGRRYRFVVALSLQDIVARNVRRMRVRIGISQDELAHRCGLHRTYVGGIERAERNISLGSIEKLAGALGVKAAALLCEGDDNG